MERSILYLLFFFGLVSNANGQETSSYSVEERKLNHFHAVVVTGSNISVELSDKSGDISVVSAPERWLKNIKTKVSSDTLFVYMDYKGDPNWKGLLNSAIQARLIIPAQPLLKGITLVEGGQLISASAIKRTTLSVNLSCGGVLKGILNCNALYIKMTSGTKMNVSGYVNQMDINSQGGSVFEGKELLAMHCKAEAYSSSKITLNVDETLIASAVNYSKIYYKSKKNCYITKMVKQNGLIKNL